MKAGQSKDVVEFNKIEVCNLVENAELIENQQILIASLEKFAGIKLITFFAEFGFDIFVISKIWTPGRIILRMLYANESSIVLMLLSLLQNESIDATFGSVLRPLLKQPAVPKTGGRYNFLQYC